MAEEGIQRRLAAIVAADMVGYSRLMPEDEAGTIARQKAHRKELIDPNIAEHRTRLVQAGLPECPLMGWTDRAPIRTL
jgi:adenylate cyclase